MLFIVPCLYVCVDNCRMQERNYDRMQEIIKQILISHGIDQTIWPLGWSIQLDYCPRPTPQAIDPSGQIVWSIPWLTSQYLYNITSDANNYISLPLSIQLWSLLSYLLSLNMMAMTRCGTYYLITVWYILLDHGVVHITWSRCGTYYLITVWYMLQCGPSVCH